MGSPEDKVKRRFTRRSHIVKDLHSDKYRQRVVKDKKGRTVDLSKLSHRELVELMQDE